jgi:hypothetical protein
MMPAAAHVAPPAMTFAAPMMPAAAFAAPSPSGFALKLTLQLPDGMECPIDLHLGAEHWNPAQLPQLIAGLIAQGWPIKTYRPRQQFGGNGFGGGNGNSYGGGGFRGNGNGYGGGYGRGRWGR